MSTLWGKTMAEIDADHRQMLADRLAREQAATPQQLGQHYGNALQPYKPTQQERFDAMVRETAVRRDYHFGTDIPAPTWQEVEEERARTGEDDAGHAGAIVAVAVMAMSLVAVAAALYFVLT